MPDQKTCCLRGAVFICALSLFWATPLIVHRPGCQRSVKDFGAVGDGNADDRKAVQAAIDNVAANGGGVVFFPAGTYKVTIYAPHIGQFPWPRALTIRSNVTLQGVNSTSSVIKLADNQIPYGAFLAPQPLDAHISNFRMRDLGVDTNALHNPLPTDAEIHQSVWEKRRDRNGIFIFDANGLRFERCRFSNFVGVWCLNLYSYQVSDVTIADNVFENVGGGNVDFDSSTVDVAGSNCRIVNNKFYSSNYSAPRGPLTYGLRTAIEVHNVDMFVADNQIYGFPIGINLGGNSPHGNRSITASGNYIENTFNGIVVYSERPDDRSSVGMRDCSIRENTITINVDGWQFYAGAGDRCHGISITRLGNSDAENWNMMVANNHITYTNYRGTRDTLTDAYSAGICYDRYNYQSHTIGARSKNLHFLNNTIDHPLGNGLYFRAAMSEVEILGNTIIDAAAGPASFWEGWKAALFFVGHQSDLSISYNRFVDDRVPPKMPSGIFAVNEDRGFRTAQANRLVDGSNNDLDIPLLQQENETGNSEH